MDVYVHGTAMYLNIYQEHAELSYPGERKKRTIPIVLPPSGGAAAAPLGEAMSCQLRPGTLPGGLGDIQAVPKWLYSACAYMFMN
jgi:hypothetical protein